jgi:hypothetical protein
MVPVGFSLELVKTCRRSKPPKQKPEVDIVWRLHMFVLICYVLKCLTGLLVLSGVVKIVPDTITFYLIWIVISYWLVAVPVHMYLTFVLVGKHPVREEFQMLKRKPYQRILMNDGLLAGLSIGAFFL